MVSDSNTLKLEGIIARSDLVKPFVGLFDEEHRFEAFQQGPVASALKALFHRGPSGG